MNWQSIERFASFPKMETELEYRITQREAKEILALRAALAAAIAERDALREENEALAYELKCFHGGNDGDDVHYCGKCDDHVASAEEIRENISRRRADAAKGGKG